MQSAAFDPNAVDGTEEAPEAHHVICTSQLRGGHGNHPHM
jgi:hypothetical protein